MCRSWYEATAATAYTGTGLLLDNGEPQTCVQLICTQAIYCRYFRHVVLLGEKQLYEAIAKQNGTELD